MLRSRPATLSVWPTTCSFRAGVAFNIAQVPGLAVTVEYRFLGTLQPRLQVRYDNPATGATVAHHPLADAATARWRAAVDAHDLAGFVLDADGIHHDHRGAAYAGYVATWSPNLRVVDADAARALAALATVAIGDRDAVAAAHAALTAAAEPPYAVQFAVGAHPGKHAVLTRAAGPTKGTALAALCEAAGCTLADAVAVGDWVNDVPMFAVAGRSFAMGGAPDDVRARATDQLATPAGAGGGIAEAIRRAWG